MKKIQEIQEEEYDFPYHYLPTYEGDFQLTKVWRWGLQYIATQKYLIEHLKNIKFNSLIDVGCGDGRLVKDISHYFKEKEIVGIDISKKAIDLAKALNQNLNFICEDVCSLPLDNKYDVATCIEVIEHIHPKHLPEFIEGLSDIIKKNGVLFLTTPTTKKRVSKKHFQHFTREQIIDLLTPYFHIKINRYIHTPNWKLVLLMKMLVNKWYLLNHPTLLNFIFENYYKEVFLSESTNGHRFFVLATRK